MFITDFLLLLFLKLIEAVLGTNSGGEEVLQEYHTTQTLTDATRRKMVNILVAHMIDKHGYVCSICVYSFFFLNTNNCLAIT